jgi:hypothetical protein
MAEFRHLKADRSWGENLKGKQLEGGSMRRTIFAVIAALLVGAMPVIAANGDQTATAAPFEQRRAQVLQRIDQRIIHLQEVRACVAAAPTPEALRDCMLMQGGAIRQGRGRPRTGQ